MHKRILAAAMAVCLLFAGCSDEQTEDNGYKIFSDGTYVLQEEEVVPEIGYDFADFYIPEGMIMDFR